jgi:glycosyltransferase involved in cell wall biosynthesis
MRLAVAVSHPVQYYAPLFRALAMRCDLHVFYGQELTPAQQGAEGFRAAFTWDVDLLSGYVSTTLHNVSRTPGSASFANCDTPEIAARLREGRFDCVLVLGWYLKCYLQSLLAAKRLHLPVLVRGDSHLEMTRSALKRSVKAVINPVFLRLFDGALYVGQKSRAFYEHYHYPAHRLFFSPHCVDNDWFSTRATPEARTRIRGSRRIGPDTFVVLFAGKLIPFKRPLDVIAAATICRAQGRAVEVMIAGSGELDAELCVRADLSGVPLHMLGFCNQTEMPPAYAAADALVLPSDGRETWGLVANEALACGRPVIVSDACGCAPDLAADGAVGRIVPVGDIEALAGAIAGMIDQPPCASDIRALAERYSVARAVDGIIDGAEAVRRIAKGNRGRSAG